ncbi:hypothetical protein OIU78_024874 [Salix suchowensis]|nr:hypothetical protein OIU78_024874 [Salix suchowensis]
MPFTKILTLQRVAVRVAEEKGVAAEEKKRREKGGLCADEKEKAEGRRVCRADEKRRQKGEGCGVREEDKKAREGALGAEEDKVFVQIWVKKIRFLKICEKKINRPEKGLWVQRR